MNGPDHGTSVDWRPDWRSSAACRGMDGEIWYPNVSHHGAQQHRYRVAARDALDVCHTCPVTAECLAQALAWEGTTSTDYRHGVWGGKTPAQRATIARRKARKKGKT